MKRALLLLVLCACGAPGTTDVLVWRTATGPAFRLEGDCSPSAVSQPRTTEVRMTSCLAGTPPPTLVESQAELDALLTPGCAASSLSTDVAIDFTTQRALVLSTRGASEWFLFPHFVAERSDALEVGLVIRPQGFPPPDNVVVLPKNGAPIELRWCRSVCTARCDQAIP